MLRTLLDPPLTPPSQSTPTSSSLLFPSHWPTTSTPQTGLLFGRFAEQSPHTRSEQVSLMDENDVPCATRLISSWPAVSKQPVQALLACVPMRSLFK